ncbi:UNVERIFIED_CONTAM: Zinc finger CCHC domain-containing protein 7 [Gekko kuhli]
MFLGEGGTDWAISDKDLEAQIGNYVTVRRNNRYYMPDKNVTCRNCDKRGHLSKNCPTPKRLVTTILSFNDAFTASQNYQVTSPWAMVEKG